MAAAPGLMTIEEYSQRPDPGYPEELVRGRIVPLPLTMPRQGQGQGQICGRCVGILGDFADDLGRVLCNDTGVITERDSDTLRGADISFYSYARVPKGPLPADYFEVPPELVLEVRSPDDRRVGPMLGQPAIQLRLPFLAKIRPMPPIGEPIPKLLDEPDSILDGSAIDFGKDSRDVHR